MNEIMIMSHIQCSKCLIRTNILILFILTLSYAMHQPNPLHHGTTESESMVHSKRISAFNNYNSSSSSNNNNNNNNRFSSIKQILYHTPNRHPNETLRWHKINMISNLFKHRVKRKAIPTLANQPLPSSGQIASKAIIYDRNSSTNIIDFTHNIQIMEILTFVHLNILLNQRSIHNASDILALNFSHNVIKQIDANILESLEHVRRLDLSHNHIQWFNVSAPANQIEWLSISGNQLHSFDGKNLVNLKYLDLSCNNIEHSTQIQLNELSELEYIDLSGNQLIQIQRHVFEKLIKLKVISLSHNRLESINNDVFRNSVDVEALDLSHNQITFVESTSFAFLPKLQYLDLSHNVIDAVSLHAFLGIPNLIKLSIAFNTQLEDALQGFISSWSLKRLDMSGTGLCEVPNALTQSVRTLNVSNNEFMVIRCGDLDSYPLLQHLDISSCQISDIEDDALGRLDMLTTLHLNNNNIVRVPSSLPVNLVRLFLHNNRIAEIQSSTFSHLVNLEVVNLSGNQLTYLPSLPLPRLMILDLRSVGLRRLSQSIIKMSPELKVVYLDGNPIKCNELVGVAEWATPCRTDDFVELGNSDGDKNASYNEDEDRIDMEILSHCECEMCRSVQTPINVSKQHCMAKNITTSKRTRLPENPPTLSSEHSIGPKKIVDRHSDGSSLFDSESKGTNNSMKMVGDTEAHKNQDPINNQTETYHQQLKHMNISYTHDSPDTHSIKRKANNKTLVSMAQEIEPIDKLNVPNIIAANCTKSPQSGNIITNDIQNANTNISDAAKSSLLETDSIFGTKINARSMETNEKGDLAGASTSLPNAKGIKMTNLSKSIMEKITSKKSEQIESLKHKEVLDRNQARIRFDYQISADNVNKQRNRQNDEHYETNKMSIPSNKLESSTATEFATAQTTAIAASNIPINDEQKRFSQHPKYDDSDHKENKSEVNWNINKAISTTNDNLQRDRNLVISTFYAGGDNALDGVRINEINKNQLADRNQLNESHTPNVTVAREKPVKESQSPQPQQQSQQQKCPLMKKCEPSLKEKENFSKGLNKRIINSNTFTEIGMVINGGNENGQQMNAMNARTGSVALARGKIVAENEQMPDNGIGLMKANKESANIGSTEMSTVSSILSEPNQRLNNVSDTMANSRNHTMVERKSSGFEIEADNVKVDDNDSNREKNKQTQQIKNTVRFTTEISEKENPLIGRISQNVSIIDNEHQFERHININHSMHGQNTFESSTNTKLQSANEHVQPNTQDDNSAVVGDDDDDGNGNGDDRHIGIGDVSDNSAIHGVSEQWNDERVTSGHSGLYVVIGIGIGVFVTLNLLHIYRHKKRYNSQRNDESMEQNRQAQNLPLVGMQMEMFNSIHYTDTPIDLW